MSPRLTPGFEPWRPVFVARLPDLEDALRAELGPIRARTLALRLVDDETGPVLVAVVDTGDRDRAGVARIVAGQLDPVVGVVPGMTVRVEFGGPRWLHAVS